MQYVCAYICLYVLYMYSILQEKKFSIDRVKSSRIELYGMENGSAAVIDGTVVCCLV